VKRRKVTYPVAKTHTKGLPRVGAGPDATVRPNLATIDVTAITGRKDLGVGARVRIMGTGLYAGEEAVIERFATTVIPAATVRTKLGRTRQVRTIDLELIAASH
jgi:hypothetical protein